MSHSYKIVVIGAASSGKTSLTQRACEDTFSEATVTTIGVEYARKTININGKEVRAQIYDTAGSERYAMVTRTLFTGARGVFLVYDITKKKTFEEAPRWFNEVKVRIPDDTPIFLVGNKCDLESQREVTADEADRYAKANGMLFIETSAKASTNVEKAFEWLAKQILEVEERREAKVAAEAAANGAVGPAAARVRPTEQGGAESGKVDLSKPAAPPAKSGGCKC